MSNLKIGILGGMGPRASVEFEARLLARLQGNDQSLPSIISVNNSQIPDRSSFLQGRGTDPLPELIQSAKILQYAQVDVVCMPCNTAHSSLILQRLQAVAPLPILDMPSACMLYAESQGFKKVLVLCTQGTALSGVFDDRSSTVACQYPAPSDQAVVSHTIATLKCHGTISDDNRQALKRILKKSNVDAAILACTELSLLPKEIFDTTMPIIDSLDCLIQACITINSTHITIGEPV